jgi:hypothetical protein
VIHVYPDPSDATLASIDAAVAAIDTSNLDVAVSTRASQSSVDTIDANVDTLVTNVAAIKSDTDAYLDAAVSSVAIKTQANFIRDTSVSTDTLGAFAHELEGYGAAYTAGALSAGVYSELLSVTASGYLWMVITHREASFSSGTLSTRITTDGDAWDVITDSASTTAQAGHVAHGVASNGNTIIIPMPVRFSTSLKVEIASSVGQTASKATARILYSLDT